MSKLKRFLGDKQFYKTVFAIITPIMLQQLLLSMAGYIDNLMINSYGGAGFVEAYNGVSAANRIIFVLNFTCLGIASTASIFISQYFGAKNFDKVKESFRLSIYCAAIFGALSFFVIEFFGDAIVNSFVQSAEARYYGYRYLDYIKWNAVIMCFVMMIANGLRSVKQTILPLIAAAAGIVINIFFNWLLIFGHWGFPELDAAGAAIATVLSRCVEVSILLIYALFSKKSLFVGAFKKLSVDKKLLAAFAKKGVPLVSNEILWSIGCTLFALFYCWRNDLWYNAYAYAQNISDLFFIVFAGMGNGTAVIVGSTLGAGDFETAKENADKMKGLGVMLGVTLGALMIATSSLTASLFQPDAATKKIVVSVLCIIGVFLAVYAYNTVNFFILRSGGDSLSAFLLDQLPTYFLGISLAALLGINATKWGLTLPLIFLITHVSDITKLFLGDWLVKKEKWVVNLTLDEPKLDVAK